MKYLILGSSFLLCWTSCSKKSADNPDPIVSLKPVAKEFIFIPKAEASWRLHLQGNHYQNSNGTQFDTGFHFDVVITALGRDSIYSGHIYSKYTSTVTTYHSNNASLNDVSSVDLLLRQDSLTGVVYYIQYTSVTKWAENYLFHFPLAIGDTVHNINGNAIIVSKDSFLLAGVHFDYWKMQLIKNGAIYFYQGEGIGSSSGIVLADFPHAGSGSIARRITFTYKGDSVSFAFPLYY